MSHLLINGESTDRLPVSDRGLQYGDGLFETVKVQGAVLCHWHDHLARLQEGCQRLKIPAPDIHTLETEAHQLIERSANEDGDNDKAAPSSRVLKIIITRGTGQRGYRLPEPCHPTRIIALYPYPHYPAEHWTHGVKVTLCKTRLACNRLLAGIKHLNRLEQVLARSEWDDDGIVDGIMLDQQEQVIEATMSNVFMVKNGALATPDLSDCGVAGVMRNQILIAANQLQLPVNIGQYFIEDLFSADEIFITNSVHGIWPVRSIDQQELSPGPVTKKLMDTLV
ncbi:MAG: aminodeoxychorismate lyase [Gammaproteobacteria bacterium]